MAESQVDDALFPSKDDAAAAEAAWSGGAEALANGSPVGNLTLEITDAELMRSASSSRLQIHYELTILAGVAAGVVLHKYDGLDKPETAKISQSQLKRLGIDTSKVSLKTLPAVLLNLKGKKISANAKQNGEFYNIYFTKVLTDSLDGAPSTPGAAKAGKGPAAKGGRKF